MPEQPDGCNDAAALFDNSGVFGLLSALLSPSAAASCFTGLQQCGLAPDLQMSLVHLAEQAAYVLLW